MLSGQKRTPGIGDPEPRWLDILIGVAVIAAAVVRVRGGSTMRLVVVGALGFAFGLTPPSVTMAANLDCWLIGNVVGKSAMSSEQFAFVDDSLGTGMLCFTEDGGYVIGNDLQLVRFGESTLVGWGTNERGLETVNTYQIDRVRQKLFHTATRIGTATQAPILPDYAAAFVGDAVPAPKD